MQMGTIEQLIRILLYAGGSAWLGSAVADGQMFQAAIGGVVAVATFVWWLLRERQVKSATK